MLKADFHIHTRKDPMDNISYSAKTMINYASKLKYKVLAITNHDQVLYNNTLKNYAKKKGILLIPGIETTINGKEVLLLNIKKLPKLKEFHDLEKLQKENAYVIAPHPFYPWLNCLRKKLIENIRFFQGIEFSSFHNNLTTIFNNKAKRVAAKFKKTLIGTSDAHHLSRIGKTFSLLDCRQKIDDVLEALKKNKIKVVSFPLSYIETVHTGIEFCFSQIKRNLYKRRL